MNKMPVLKTSMKVDRFEEKLRKSEQRFSQLFNSMNEMFQTLELIYDEKGQAVDFRYLEVNPATEKMVNKSRDEMIGKSAKELFGVVEDYWIQALSSIGMTLGHPGELAHLQLI
jgi:two-component system, chemotaxis family, CheB/CheR fusion protein